MWIEIWNKNQSEEAFEFTCTCYYPGIQCDYQAPHEIKRKGHTEVTEVGHKIVSGSSFEAYILFYEKYDSQRK